MNKMLEQVFKKFKNKSSFFEIDGDVRILSTDNNKFTIREDAHMVFVTVYDIDGTEIAVSEASKFGKELYICDIWAVPETDTIDDHIFDTIIKVYIEYGKEIHMKSLTYMLTIDGYRYGDRKRDIAINNIKDSTIYKKLRRNGFKIRVGDRPYEWIDEDRLSMNLIRHL